LNKGWERHQLATAVGDAGAQDFRQRQGQLLARFLHHAVQGDEILRLAQCVAHLIAADQVERRRLVSLFQAYQLDGLACLGVEAANQFGQAGRIVLTQVVRQGRFAGRRLAGCFGWRLGCLGGQGKGQGEGNGRGK